MISFTRAERRTYLILGALGVVILGVAAAGQFPYLETSPFAFALPDYAAY